MVTVSGAAARDRRLERDLGGDRHRPVAAVPQREGRAIEIAGADQRRHARIDRQILHRADLGAAHAEQIAAGGRDRDQLVGRTANRRAAPSPTRGHWHRAGRGPSTAAPAGNRRGSAPTDRRRRRRRPRAPCGRNGACRRPASAPVEVSTDSGRSPIIALSTSQLSLGESWSSASSTAAKAISAERGGLPSGAGHLHRDPRLVADVIFRRDRPSPRPGADAPSQPTCTLAMPMR